MLSGLGTMLIVVTQPEGMAGTNVAQLRSAWRALAGWTNRRAGEHRPADTGTAAEAVAGVGITRPAPAVPGTKAPGAETTRGARHV